jgi:SAM-dependent methyltransferase
MTQQAYWNSIGAHKEFTTPFQMDDFQKLVHMNARVLDVGCGYGRTLNELYEKGYTNTVGIDFSVKMFERGRNAYPYLTWQTMEKLKSFEMLRFEETTYPTMNGNLSNGYYYFGRKL